MTINKFWQLKDVFLIFVPFRFTYTVQYPYYKTSNNYKKSETLTKHFSLRRGSGLIFGPIFRTAKFTSMKTVPQFGGGRSVRSFPVSSNQSTLSLRVISVRHDGFFKSRHMYYQHKLRGCA